jgi:hypothetical protein
MKSMRRRAMIANCEPGLRWRQLILANTRVLVSFGMGLLSTRRSFPRKRESTPWTAHFRRFAEWIPAFAGMTVACNAHVSQMTPVPNAR